MRNTIIAAVIAVLVMALPIWEMNTAQYIVGAICVWMISMIVLVSTENGSL